MKFILALVLLCSAAMVLPPFGRAQGFVNLNFSQATIVVDPSGPAYSSSVYVSNAVPGWTVYSGGVPQTDVLYNEETHGEASASIIGTNSTLVTGIPGFAYTVLLQAGLGNVTTNVPVSISQTAKIPVYAQSVFFTASQPYQSGWQVTVGGQVVTVYQMSETTTSTLLYGVYAANVSAFAGQVEQLEFTSLSSPTTYDTMDLTGISFSTTVVPEPSLPALSALGGLLFFGCRRWRIFPK